ncbi:unnamed protein product [Sphenostylis stenocarpa]|uniref:Uncharacterized protein n=1 Tax=Sphenostylis stenocarpa TaxID=92480 RepID=A0AA86VSP9_9FABA|nr:unnamed protein product [Sphenostylis stenocarpa]
MDASSSSGKDKISQGSVEVTLFVVTTRCKVTCDLICHVALLLASIYLAFTKVGGKVKRTYHLP